MQEIDFTELTPLGEGIFSTVYQHPDEENQVIKRRHLELNEIDGWFPYAKAIKSGMLELINPPRIHELQVLNNENDNGIYSNYYAILDKLYTVYDDDSDCFINIPYSWHEHLRILTEGILYQKVSTLSDINIVDDITDMLPDNIPEEITFLCEDIVRAITFARTLDYDLELDVHEENIMVSSYGKLILTDPFSHI